MEKLTFKERSYQNRIGMYSKLIKESYDEIMEECEEMDEVAIYEVSNVLIPSVVVFAVVPLLEAQGISVSYKGDLPNSGKQAYSLSWL